MQSNPDPPKTPSSRMSNSASGSLRRGTEEGPVHTTSFQDSGPWKRWESPPPHQAEPLWVYAKAIDKTTVGNLKPQRWTTAADLQILGNAWGHWAWTRVFFFSMLAVVYCLRVGDLESICWAYISSPQFFTFWDEKCN